MVYISLQEAAIMTGLEVRVLRNWIKNHIIKGYRQGGESKVIKLDSKELLYATKALLNPGPKTAPTRANLDEESLCFYADDNDLISQQEAANIFNVTPKTITNWISLGFVRGYKTGPTLIRVRISDIEKYLNDYKMPSYPLSRSFNSLQKSKAALKEVVSK